MVILLSVVDTSHCLRPATTDMSKGRSREHAGIHRVRARRSCALNSRRRRSCGHAPGYPTRTAQPFRFAGSSAVLTAMTVEPLDHVRRTDRYSRRDIARASLSLTRSASLARFGLPVAATVWVGSTASFMREGRIACAEELVSRARAS